MPRASISNSNRLTGTGILITTALIALLVSSCREKDDNIVGPGPGPGGSWIVILEDVPTLFVPNDTINVRLFNPQGALSIGQTLRFAAVVDSIPITRTAQTSDTVSRFWGCNPPLLYWGDGSEDQETPSETIHAYFINPDPPHDTLAHAFRSYRVLPRP